MASSPKDKAEPTTGGSPRLAHASPRHGSGPTMATAKTNTATILLLITIHFASCKTKLKSVEPSTGSLNGGTLLTLHGEGFAASQFSFGAGNENKGNKVYLMSPTLGQSVPCDVHKEGCTTERITCYTRPMVKSQYFARLMVDGEAVPLEDTCNMLSSCTYFPGLPNTPTIDRLIPQSGPPGSLVEMKGAIFTAFYTSNILAANATNNITEHIKRVFAGPQKCELINEETNSLYKIQLDGPNGELNTGSIQCKMQGSYVGHQDMNFIISGPYGRSLTNPSVKRVSTRDKVYMFQTYAEITGVSPGTGSLVGGTLLTLTGKNFDQTDAPARVVVGGLDCKVKTVKDEQIVCVTQAQPKDTKTLHPGNRGFVHETWADVTKSLDELESISALTSSSAGYKKAIIDDAQYVDESGKPKAGKLSGFFTPPRDSDYSFGIKGFDEIKLFVSESDDPSAKNMSGSNFNSKRNWYHPFVGRQITKRFPMKKEKNYYVELLHSGKTNATLGMKQYVTALHKGKTESTIGEEQLLKFKAKESGEIQVMDFSKIPKTQSASNEVQTLTVKTSETFQLSVGNVYTDFLAVDDEDTAVQAALNDLPSIYPDTVNVKAETVTGGGVKYTVTFQSERGSFPVIAAKVKGAKSTITGARTKTGKPSHKFVHLEYEGVTAKPISRSPKPNDLKSAIESVLVPQCPNSFINPPRDGTLIAEDYEGVYSKKAPLEELARNTMDAFCGRTALKRGTVIYKSSRAFPLATYPWVCFAYRGAYRPIMNIGAKSPAKFSRRSVAIDIKQASEWQYGCWNLDETLKKAYTGYDGFQITEISLILNNVMLHVDSYIDAIYIGKKPLNTDNTAGLSRRLVPPFVHKSVAVTSAGGKYTVTISPLYCASGIQLLGARGMTSSQLSVTRSQAASAGISGTIDLLFNGTVIKDIPTVYSPHDYKTDARVRQLLESAPTMGALEVTYTRTTHTCYEFTRIIRWKTAPGDQPQLQVLNKKNLKGTEASLDVSTYQDGHVFHNILAGDWFRTTHPKPQVMAYINGIPTKCSGKCDFEWDNAATPTAKTLTPTSGTQGTVLTVTGTGFDSKTPANNLITISDRACVVVSATETVIKCTVGEGAVGQHVVDFTVIGKGAPSYGNGQFKFTYTAVITGISPKKGSIGGATQLTVSGKGFSNKAIVKVGGVECLSYTSKSFSQIVCETPPGTSAASVDVTLEQAGMAAITSKQQFAYDNANTPVVTSISGSAAHVEGSTVITIKGTKFGTEKARVTVGVKPATVLKTADTEMTVRLPSLPDGSYPLVVVVPGKGSADMSKNNIPKIKYIFKLTSVSPVEGSVYGGTRLTIGGNGFSTDVTASVIKFGAHSCIAKSASTTKIECEMDWTATTHEVTNNGVHPDFGDGYAWDKQSLKIEVGDIVQWTWEATPFSVGYGYLVQETKSATNDELKAGGFSSGSVKSAKGSFSYKFVRPGVYYYWSGPVDEYERIYMRGKVEVVAKASFVDTLKMTVANYEPIYKLGGSRRRRSVGCSTVSGALAGCDVTKPKVTSSTKYSFTFWSCLAPRVTAVSPSSGTAKDTITITGEGFGTQKCQNVVLVGGKPCTVQSTTATSIKCTVDPQGSLEVGKPLAVSVNVHGRGYALMDIQLASGRTFTLNPYVESVSPSAGSIKGETTITVTGGGFSQSSGGIGLTTKKSPCQISEIKYDKIICKTTQASSGVGDVIVSVGSTSSVCKGSCKYTYSADKTPTVTGVTPTKINSGGNKVTLTGKHYGTDKSAITVRIGSETCEVTSVADTKIECSVGNLPVGDNYIYIHVTGKGKASTSKKIEGEAVITSISPTSVSTNGAILTLVGNGFTDGTVIMANRQVCTNLAVNLGRVECRLAANKVARIAVHIKVDSLPYESQEVAFTADSTPTVTAVSPAKGTTSDSVKITGTGFSTASDGNIIMLGGSKCAPTKQTATEITCTVQSHAAGEYPVTVHVNQKGYASGAFNFTYDLSVSSVSPAKGSFGGGQDIVITGKGLSQNAVVTVCGNVCVNKDGASSTTLGCVTPANSGTGTLDCDVKVSYGLGVATKSAAYQYLASLTPVISDVTPRRGGTGGGTKITITGAKFGTDKSKVNVDIAGITCPIKSLADDKIICETEPRKPPTKTKIKITVGTQGIATQDKADFQYIDVWSSKFTWGGLDPPTAGDFIIVPTGQTLLVDVNTPILKMVLIMGGQLIFDDKDLELNAENILITHGGLLQIGTEEEPFQHKAYINMHGALRAPELPIYGAKTLAVRHGTVELHGKPVKTWTLLDKNAAAGTNTIVLQHKVTWSAGDVIVVASTGGHMSQKETEKHTIASVASDGVTITLKDKLKYEHMGETQTFDGVKVEIRAEVGLLTRNIVFKGTSNSQWNDKIKPCPEDFNPEVFAEQKCFQGRFGEEMGSDEYGAQIMLHQAKMDTKEAVAHIEYVEMTYVGQAYRLGRYPVHFHINGDMSGSYVRGMGIHKTFNRAINLHNSHNVLVEHNVVYDVMGGAIFLEDGIETGNVLQYNLVMFVKASSSLLNDDITPSAFWITHPNNTIRHNHVAGGTHFGFWYRFHRHPDGASFTKSICTKITPIQPDQFVNNTVHSVGWYGLWVFEEYLPTRTGECGSSDYVAGVFGKLVTWNAMRGAEWGEGSGIQFHDMILANNYMAGIEALFANHRARPGEEYTENGPMFKNNVIIGHLNHKNRPPATRQGLVLPFMNGLLVDGLTFINFDEKDTVAIGLVQIICVCSKLCDGWTSKYKNIKWVNSPRKANMRFRDMFELHDLDGSLMGTKGGRVLAESALLPKDKCKKQPLGSEFSCGVWPAVLCGAEVDVVRFSFHEISPDSLNFKDLKVTNQHGSALINWWRKKPVEAMGWSVFLLAGEEHTLEFVNGAVMSNFSYIGSVRGMEKGNYVIIKHKLAQKNNYFENIPGIKQAMSSQALTYEANYDGDWFWEDKAKTLSFIVSDNRTLETGKMINIRPVHLKFLGCPTKDCSPPKDPSTLPPATSRPKTAVLWSATESWKNAEDGYGGNYGAGKYGPPKTDGDNVKIPTGVWMVVDQSPVPMNKLEIYGVMELDNAKDSSGKYKNFAITASYIVIRGGRLIIGWPDKPFLGNVVITLQGTSKSEMYPQDGGTTIGSKAIGVFGGLDLHGVARTNHWTCLAKQALPGDKSVTLMAAVDWVVGDEIVVAPTQYLAWETETFKVTAVSADKKTLTLNATIKYKHISYTETISASNKTYSMRAEVGLLTRNIKVVGGEYDKIDTEGFGGRVVVGTISDPDDPAKGYTGYARVCNVEFSRMGQLGYTSPFDPRYSLSYVNTGDVSDVKPSYVKDNVFRNGFSPAIGVFGGNGIAIENNVIHHTIGESVVINGDGNSLRGNLVVLSVNPATYLDRYERSAYMKTPAAFDLSATFNVTIQGNTVAGAEQVGFRVNGEFCSRAEDAEDRWYGNTAHSTMIGLLMGPDNCHAKAKCSLLHGFSIWRAAHFGMFIQTKCSLVMKDMTVADNGLGMYTMTIYPRSDRHEEPHYHYHHLRDSLVMGRTPAYDCSAGRIAKTDHNMLNSYVSVPFYVDEESHAGHIGISLPVFASMENRFPAKHWVVSVLPPATLGVMKVKDTTFGYFKKSCGQKVSDVVFAPCLDNGNTHHPVETSGITLHETPLEGRAFIHRPRKSKIAGGLCGDLACDTTSKALINDRDGSFLGGSSGALVPHSEFQWGGDGSYGLGDNRVPKTMQTDADGNRIKMDKIAQHRGVIRNSKCVYQSAWQAYECHDLNYKMLTTVSMDHDHMERRLGPVAILGDGYIDLSNGPRDKGICKGYPCNRRLAAYSMIVATGKTYKVYYTGSCSQKTRLYLLNAEAKDAIVVGIFYDYRQRFEIFQNGKFIKASNYESRNGQDNYKSGNFMPAISDPAGTNWYDSDNQIVWVVVKGDRAHEIRMTPAVMVSMALPAMSVDDFFGKNLVENLRQFLGLSKSKIRVVNAVRETSRRRKRATFSLKVTLEISHNIDNSTNTTTAALDEVDSDLLREELKNVSNKLVEAVQLNLLSSALNLTVKAIQLTDALPDSNSTGWTEALKNIEVGQTQKKVIAAGGMHVHVQPKGSHEGAVFSVQPAVKVVDSEGNLMVDTRSASGPWQMMASLVPNKGDAKAKLLGTTTVDVVKGWANFTDLAVSHSGKGYQIYFKVVGLSVVTPDYLKTTSGSLDLAPRTLAANLVHKTYMHTAKEGFDFDVEIVDKDTKEKISDIAWRGHTWTCSVTLEKPSTENPRLGGPTVGTFSAQTGVASFRGVNIDIDGRAILRTEVKSVPEEYTLVRYDIVTVFTKNYKVPVVEASKKVKLTFDADYDAIVKSKEDFFSATMYNKLKPHMPDVTLSSFKISKGSILVEFQAIGSGDAIERGLETVHSKLKDGLTVHFYRDSMTAKPTMHVDGDVYTPPAKAAPSELPLIPIIAGAAGAVLLVVIVVIVVVVKKNKSNAAYKKGSVLGFHHHGLDSRQSPVSVEINDECSTPSRSNTSQSTLVTHAQPRPGSRNSKVAPIDN